MIPLDNAALLALGVLIGAYATAIGAGGGFLIAPLLLLRYPGVRPEFVTTASLGFVAVSSGLSSVVGLREGRVDRGVAAALSLIAVPAALLGAAVTTLLPRAWFAAGFAVLLLALAAFLVWRPTAPDFDEAPRGWRRRLQDRRGNTFSYRVPMARTIAPIVVATFLSTLAGISGGPIKVPLMTRLMRMPHAVAVLTVQLLNFATAAAAVSLHLAAGHGGDPLRDAVWLGAGAIIGNPLGQRLRRRLGEGPLTRLLALGLVVVAIRTAATAL